MAIETSETTPWRVSWELINARAWWLLEHTSSLKPSLVVDGLMTYGHPRLRLWDDAGGFGCESEPMSLTVFDPSTTPQGNRLYERRCGTRRVAYGVWTLWWMRPTRRQHRSRQSRSEMRTSLLSS